MGGEPRGACCWATETPGRIWLPARPLERAPLFRGAACARGELRFFPNHLDSMIAWPPRNEACFPTRSLRPLAASQTILDMITGARLVNQAWRPLAYKPTSGQHLFSPNLFILTALLFLSFGFTATFYKISLPTRA